jgi:hypothetical protein
MLIKFSFLIMLAWLLNFSSAKTQAITGRNIDDHLLIKDSQKGLGLDVSKDTEGTPYLTETFAMGEVYLDKGKHTVPVRYNIYDDWIEYQQNDQTYVLDPNGHIKSVRFDDQVLVVEKYNFKGKTKHGYFVLLDSGKVMLFSKKVVTYRESQEAKALESGSTPAKYIRASDLYFYKVGNGELKKVDSLKNMIASLPDKQDELNQFAKKEKISARKEEELIKFVKYYNSL